MTYRNNLDNTFKSLQYMKDFVKSELKTIDSTLSPSQTTSTGGIFYLSNFAEGDDLAQRQGRSMRAKSLLFRWNAQINSNTAAITSQTIRYILFIDTQNNGGTPAVTDLLATGDYLSALNIQINPNRFIILRDYIIPLFINGDGNLCGDEFIKLDHHIHYGGTTGSQSDARSGSIWLLLISNIPSSNSYLPTLYWNSRVRAYDN